MTREFELFIRGRTMATAKAMSTNEAEVVKKVWLGRLTKLVDEIKSSAEASGWRTRRIDKTVTEQELGTYKVPVLLMEKDTVEVVLNPVARFVPGAEGAVDMYLAPAYDDIASLYFEGGQWVLHYAEHPNPMATRSVVEIKQQPYSSEAIITVLDGMAANG